MDSLLETVELTFHDLALADESNNIHVNIERLEELLQEEDVREDNELRFTIHNFLSSQYLRLYQLSDNRELLDRAGNHAQKALSIFENREEYKADLTSTYTTLIEIDALKGNYDRAIDRQKYLIDEYQSVGVGEYEQWFASEQVPKLYTTAMHESEWDRTGERVHEVVGILKEISEVYENEVGVKAEIQLLWHYHHLNESDQAERLLESIEERVDALSNPHIEEEWNRHKERLF